MGEEHERQTAKSQHKAFGRRPVARFHPVVVPCQGVSAAEVKVGRAPEPVYKTKLSDAHSEAETTQLLCYETAAFLFFPWRISSFINTLMDQCCAAAPKTFK